MKAHSYSLKCFVRASDSPPLVNSFQELLNINAQIAQNQATTAGHKLNKAFLNPAIAEMSAIAFQNARPPREGETYDNCEDRVNEHA
jgi:hypothetical protein